MDLPKMLEPQNLSEAQLYEILKNKCIEIPNMKILNKSDLLEMFERVALPMPQRQYNETRYLGKKLNEHRLSRKIPIAKEEEQASYEFAISKLKTIDRSNYTKSKKCSEESSPQLTNKSHLTYSCSEIKRSFKYAYKRKINDQETVPIQTGSKKRQKIIWP